MTPSALVPAQKPTAVCVRQRYSVVCSTPASLTAVNVGLATGTFSPRGRWQKSLDMCCLCICAKWENRFGVAVSGFRSWSTSSTCSTVARMGMPHRSGDPRSTVTASCSPPAICQERWAPASKARAFSFVQPLQRGIVLYRNFHLVRPLCEREETRVLQSDYSFTYFVRATFSHSHRTDALCLFFQLRE